MNRAETIFPAAILVCVAVFVALGYLVLEFTWTAFAFPLGAGVAVCALCAIELMRLGRSEGEPAEEAAPPLSIPSLAWTAALGLFLYGLGFVAGPAVYLLVCLRANGFSWTLAASVAAASVAVSWGLFIKMMHVLLPIAPLWMS